MAKSIKSIICPQCNSTEATKLDDGTYECKYCGAHFFIDDDTVTQNINVTVNVTQETHAPTRKKTKKEQQQEKVQENIPKQLPSSRSTMLGCIIILVIFGLIFLFFKFACNSNSPNPKFKGTIAENLINEKVWDSQVILSNGKPVFLARVKDDDDNDKYTLKIIDAKSLLVTDTINCPINPWSIKSIKKVEHYECIVTNNIVYKFDNDKRRYEDITSFILNKIPNFDKTDIVLIEKINDCYGDSYGIAITTKNNICYYYFSLTDKIYSDVNVFKSECQKIKEDKSFFILKEMGEGIYSLFKVEYVYTPGQEINWGEKKELFGRIKGNQISGCIKDVREIKRFNFGRTGSSVNRYTASIIYQEKDYLLMYYGKFENHYICELDTVGNVIWTKRMKYYFSGGGDIKGDSIIVMKGTSDNEYLIYNYIDTTFRHLEKHCVY